LSASPGGRGSPPEAAGRGSRLLARIAAWLQVGEEGALIGRNSLWLLGDRGFRLSVGLVVNAWLVRYLGTDQLGLLSFAQSIVVITAVTTQLGLETILVRDLVRRAEEQREILGTALGLRVAGWIFTAGLALLVVSVLRPGDHRAMILTAICSTTALAQTLDIIEYWFQSRAWITPVVIARLAAFVVGAVAKVAAILLRAPLEVVAIILAAEFALSSTALVVAYLRAGGSPGAWRWVTARARALLSDSWPMILNSVAIVVSVRVDQMFVTSIKGPGENGIYAAAQRLTEIIYYLPVAVMAAANPVLLRSHQKDLAEYRRRLQRTFDLLGRLGLVIAVVVSLAAPIIVHVLFGEEFRAAAAVLAIQVWSAPVLFLGIAQTNWFIAEGRQRGLMARSAVAAAASLALNLVLVPVLGARGAAISMVATQTFATWILNGLLPGTRSLFLMQCRALFPGWPR
jgi:PST family polysaccharide transporter